MIKREYKKSYLIINIILAILLVLLLLNAIVFQNTSFWFAFLALAIFFASIVIPYGYEKKRKRFMFESMFYTFSYTVLFMIIIYISGIFLGFNRTIYTLNLTNLTKNIIPYLLVILISELFRYEITRKGQTSILAHILITLILIIVDSTFYLKTFDLATGDGQIYYICVIILPTISKHILLTYTTILGGIYPSIIYRIIMDLKAFIIPITPNFGMYMESVIMTAFPVILGLLIYFSLKQFQNREVEQQSVRNTRLYAYFVYILIFIMIATLVMLTSTKFKYGLIAIGSGSMTGTINKGDVVIYKSTHNPNDFAKGDVMVFEKDGKKIVHRVIEKVEVGNDAIFYTKGDYNDSPDGYPITKEQIKGKVEKKIKYIGIPSVMLNELIHN